MRDDAREVYPVLVAGYKEISLPPAGLLVAVVAGCGRYVMYIYISIYISIVTYPSRFFHSAKVLRLNYFCY